MTDDGPTTDDVKVLHRMGYAQELARRMRGFSNFAISFSIICILAGGITSFQLGFSAGGGFAIGVGWLVGGLFALVVACSMAQIASAYPTAGGLYHWASILGGRFWGWATAWVNLLGLVFVVASVNVGAYLLFRDLILAGIFGLDVSAWGYGEQVAGIAVIALIHGLFNHLGIRATTLLTDFSGYLILVVAVALTIVMLWAAPGIEPGRLFAFVNNTGPAGGDVFPRTDSVLLAFCLGLLLPLYTITGFDASAHTAEETLDAPRAVPRGMINSVLWSLVFGYAMTCSFVLALPDPAKAAAGGATVFFDLIAGLAVPDALRNLLYVGIVTANFLCGLAAMTSTSRMIYAFARDNGLPASPWLKQVSPRYRTPVPAIWTTAVLSILVTLYSPAFAALAAGCAVFFYISYAMPIAAGLLAEGKTWTTFGPFRLGAWSRPFAVVTVLGVVLIAFIGLQPPNDILVGYAVGLVVLLALGWFLSERRRFAGPPVGDVIARRQAEIVAAEQALARGDD
ncbi:MAG: amino acid permease [Alphaproteobacteria bacterium]|nr:amino acid permease [Alphaproteobacteria bacterium]